MKTIILYCSLFLILFACNTNTLEVSEKIDYAYFPLDTGRWVIYNVTFIDIDKAIDKNDTTHFQLKELTESEFTDDEGNKAFRIERYMRSDSLLPWQIVDVWSAYIRNNSAIRTEENLRFVKLKFPVQLNLDWNGNIYNENSETTDNFTFVEVDKSYDINNLHFDSVTTVVQADKESLIDRVYFEEKYAKHVGLIEKTEIDAYSDENDFSLDVIDRITVGTIYQQTIEDYGQY